jgi:hypothetical protein
MLLIDILLKEFKSCAVPHSHCLFESVFIPINGQSKDKAIDQEDKAEYTSSKQCRRKSNYGEYCYYKILAILCHSLLFK